MQDAIFSHSIHGDSLELFQTIFRHSVHGDNRTAFLAPCGIPSIHGHNRTAFLAPCGNDPHGKDCSYNPIAFPPSMEVRCNLLGQCICPWMDGSRTTQEQLSRSNCRGAYICHPWGLGIRIPAADGLSRVPPINVSRYYLSNSGGRRPPCLVYGRYLVVTQHSSPGDSILDIIFCYTVLAARVLHSVYSP